MPSDAFISFCSEGKKVAYDRMLADLVGERIDGVMNTQLAATAATARDGVLGKSIPGWNH